MMALGSFILEMYQLVGDELAEIALRADGHIDHFALDVQNIETTFAAARLAGLDIIEDEPVFLPFWEKGIRYFKVCGPDGEKVEFCERIK
jgi:lactoylglutathione lyase